MIAIHLDYIESSAGAVGTNTFVASELHFEMAGKNKSNVEKIDSPAVRHVKTAIEKSGQDVYIAGSIGPVLGAIEPERGYRDFGIPNQAVKDARQSLIYALAEEGLLYCETMFSAKEAAIALISPEKQVFPWQ